MSKWWSVRFHMLGKSVFKQKQKKIRKVNYHCVLVLLTSVWGNIFWCACCQRELAKKFNHFWIESACKYFSSFGFNSFPMGRQRSCLRDQTRYTRTCDFRKDDTHSYWIWYPNVSNHFCQQPVYTLDHSTVHPTKWHPVFVYHRFIFMMRLKMFGPSHGKFVVTERSQW